MMTKRFGLFMGAVCLLFSFTAQAEQVVFSKVMYHPPDGLPEYVEVMNVTVTPHDMSLWRLRGGVDYDFPDFAAGNPTWTFMKPNERIILSSVDPNTLRAAYGIPASVRIYGPWSGSLDNGGERITLQDRNKVVLTTLSYGDDGRWPRAADGAGHALVLIDPNKRIDDWRNWTASTRRLGAPGAGPVAEAETPISNPEVNLSDGIPFIEYGDTWKYNADNVDLGTGWRAPGFDDSAWNEGAGLLGFENSALPAPGIQTDLTAFDQDQVTYYFRKEFNYNGGLNGVSITIDQIVDDGAMYYLNGTLIGSQGVPSSPTFTTTANRTVSNAVEEDNVISIGGSALVSGRNVLAVEVHQASTSSSDVVFGARMSISVPVQPSVVINEILPGGAGVGFVEIYNPGAQTVNLRDHYLSDDAGNLIKFRINTDVLVSAGGLVAVGYTESGMIPADPTTVFLTDPDGSTVINAISASVPLDGRSVGRKPTGSSSWFLFVEPTRGAPNASQSSLGETIRMSEVHFSGNTVDWVEFYNAGEANLPLSGLYLASKRDLSDKVELSGTAIVGGYVSQDFSFPVSGDDLTLYLVNGADVVLAAQDFSRPSVGTSVQSFPAGSGEYYVTPETTRDAANAPVRNTDIVINEIMYDPPSDEVAAEFIELYNRGSNSVDVSGWRLREAIDFVLPFGTTLPAGGYLVISADEDWMRQTYGNLPVVGNFDGRLGNNGDMVRLEEANGNLVDAVDYRGGRGPGANWPHLTHGDGSSMELRNPFMDNSVSSAWANSDTTNRTSFLPYSYSDTFRQLRTQGSVTDYRELHFFLVGDGHVILENIQVRENGVGPNILQNSDRMSGNNSSAEGWVSQGTHYASYIDALGRLHIISSGHGDIKPNRVEIDTVAMSSGTPYTISFNARWVSGTHRMIAQTWDHSIATSISLPVPRTLGTPGARNTRYITLPTAQVDELIHSPAVPTAAESVKVTARIRSVDSPNVLLFHREDNSTASAPWLNKPMFDDGFNGGDDVAGDGVYTATLNEYQSNGRVVQFYVQAAANGELSLQPRMGAVRPAMYVVDTPSTDDLRKMRLVMSQLDINAINAGNSPTPPYDYKFPRMSNHQFNMTLIVNEKEIIYGCEARNSGSPFTRGGFNRGKFKMPADQRFRGHEKLTFDERDPGGNLHNDRIARYWLYLMGHPVVENEFIRLEINDDGSSLRHEIEPMGNHSLDRNLPEGADGELYRIDDEWFFEDDWGRSSRNATWSYKDSDNAGRYRSEWILRTREDVDDYTSLIALFKKVDEGYTQAEIERLVDGDQVMLMSAVRGYIDDWDSFSRNRGKNGYFYRRSTDGRFIFWQWDSDRTFGSATAAFEAGMAGFNTYIDKSYNKRMFKHYLAHLVENFGNGSAHLAAWLQAEENASPSYTISSAYANWVINREGPANNYLGANRDAVFNITSNGGSPISTGGNTVSLAGDAPLRVHSVNVLGHPEAEFSWGSGETAWTLTGIQLKSGANFLTVQGVDHRGRVVESDVITINKSGNAPPLMDLDGKPNSFRVSLLDAFEVSAEDSVDPDGGALTYNWSITPPQDVLFDESGVSNVVVVFPRPGLYNISATGTDPGGASATQVREAAVYAPGGFTPFNDPRLSVAWREENVTVRENSMPGAYYSLSEEEGNLLMQVLDNGPLPLQTANPNYPLLWRELPPLTDWTWISKLRLRAQVFGDYMSGILVETLENGLPVRYAFGIENGDLLVVKRVTSTGVTSTLYSTALGENEVEVRIRRAGSSLRFERMIAGSWVVVRTSGLAGGVTAQKAGLFTSTDISQRIRTAFDFAALIDPSASSDLRENLRLTEIMYDPDGGSEFEFVELYNKGDLPLDLTDVAFTAGIDYTFGNIVLGPRQYLVVAKNPVAFASAYGLSGVELAPGGYSGRLDGDGETVELSDADGNVILSVRYDIDGEWPSDAKNTGRSIEVKDPSGNLGDGANWRASSDEGGSPGRATGGTAGTVIVNEVLTHSDDPLEDAIELRNVTGSSIDISGWFLSDSSSDLERFRVPNGTVLGAGGYIVFYENQFNTNNPLVPFSLSSGNGDEVFLSAADGAGNLTGYRNFVAFGAAENAVPFGIYETTVGLDFTALEARTFGADTPANLAEFRTGAGLENAGPLVGPIVINELMYHPPDIDGTNDNVGDEYVELFNITSSAVSLFDPAFPTNTWRLRGGVDMDLPQGIVIPPHGYIVVVSFDPASDPTRLGLFRSTYGMPGSVVVIGPYEGKLDNSGESVRLRKPDTPQLSGPDEGSVPYVLVDEVIYADQAPWPVTPDGTGDSVQRRRPHEYGNDSVNWKGEAPTPGRANVLGSRFVDSDADGLDDDYENANGLNFTDSSDGALDADSDGRSNYEERLDGTDPRNSGSRLIVPVITVPPVDEVTTAGGSATFSVVASGTGPLRYQWRFNGALIPGATNSTLAVMDAQAANAGAYSVVVQNVAGFEISGNARLTVNQPLEIFGQPTTQVVDVGSDVNFTVFALGTGTLRYQWRRNGVDITGATSRDLLLTDAQPGDNGDYTVVVTDDNTSVESVAANLLVLTPPTIVQQPQSVTEVAYMNVAFSVVAGGDGPFRYQWRFNGVNVIGGTNSTLVLVDAQPPQAGSYSVVVSNPSSSVTSADAILTLLIPASILQQPIGVTALPGEDAFFNVSATSSTPMSYQWKADGVDIPGANDPTLNLLNVRPEDDAIYSVVITDTVGSIESDGARLTILIPPTFVQHPQSVTLVEGDTLVLSVETGGTLPMGYRWTHDGQTRINELSDLHTSFLIIENVDETASGDYRVVITNAANSIVGGERAK